jgi:hypothetical protein
MLTFLLFLIDLKFSFFGFFILEDRCYSSLFKHLISSVQLLADGRSLLEIFAFNRERKQEKNSSILSSASRFYLTNYSV